MAECDPPEATPGTVEPRRPAETEALFDVVLAFVLLFMVPALGFAVAVGVDGASGEPPGGPLEPDDRVEAASLFQGLGALLLVGFAVFRRRLFPLCLKAGFALRCYGVFLLAWVPLAMVAYPVLVRSAGHEFPAQKSLEYFTGGGGGPFWLVLIVTCVSGPIAEELVFRGFLFRLLEGRAGPKSALVLSSVLFGIFHGTMFALPIAGLGFLFGYVRVKTGSVAPSILLHIVHNSLTVGLVLWDPHWLDLVYDK